MKSKAKFYTIISFILLLLLLIPYIFRLTTIFDENYSLMLINNNIKNIIKFDSLDVHPPLFYFLLKLFLNITTFWTNSFFVKIIFSRIFVIIISLITFIYLVKILRFLHIKNILFLQCILFLSIPGVISFTYEFIKIRMYSLGALWVVIQLYELVNYNNDYNNKRLFIISIVLICNAYTNYYSAAISGLFMLIFLFRYILHKNKNCIKIIIPIVIMFISFVPWIPILIKQVSLQSYHKLPPDMFKQFIATLVFIIMFFYPLYWSYKYLNKSYSCVFMYSLLVLIISFLFMGIMSMIYRPVFQFRYLYPAFIIYGFFSINTLIMMMRSNCKLYRLYSLLLTLILFMSCIVSYTNQLDYFGMSSISLVRDSYMWKNDNNLINLKSNDNDVNDNFILEKSIYISNMGKRIKTKHIGDIKEIHSNPSYKNLFYNVNKNIVK